MLTAIDVASERAGLVRQLIHAQHETWVDIHLSKLLYDDVKRTYTCLLTTRSPGGWCCMNHLEMRHERAHSVVWFEVGIHGIRQRCGHRYTNPQTGVRCKAFVSPLLRNGYSIEVMMQVFPSSPTVSVSRSRAPRTCPLLPVSLQDIHSQCKLGYDILAEEAWFDRPTCSAHAAPTG